MTGSAKAGIASGIVLAFAVLAGLAFFYCGEKEGRETSRGFGGWGVLGGDPNNEEARFGGGGRSG